MCSGSEAGSYLRLIDFLYHSTLGLKVMKKKKKTDTQPSAMHAAPVSQSEDGPLSAVNLVRSTCSHKWPGWPGLARGWLILATRSDVSSV